MPLSEELAGGINRRFIVAARNLFNNGSQNPVNFFGGVFDPFNNQAIIGGNNSYIGFMADLQGGKITESAALPSTAIANGQMRIVKIDFNNQTIYALDPSNNSEEIAASADGGASWFDIGTNLPAGFYNDISSWRPIAGNSQLIAARGGGAGGGQVSDDGGATWVGFDTQQPGPGADTDYIVTDPEHKVLVTLGDNGITTCFADDVTVPGNWNVLDANTDFGVGSGFATFAFNNDATKFIAVSVSRALLTTVDFVNWIEIDRDLNPFINVGTQGSGINGIVHVAALNGWILYSDDDQGNMAFVPSNESPVNTIFAGNVIGVEPASIPNLPTASVSDGDNIVIALADNKAMVLLRE